MTGDPELDAMAAVSAALNPLDADAQGRVIKWAADRHGVAVAAAPEERVPGIGNRKNVRKSAAKPTHQGDGEGEIEDIDEAVVMAAVEEHTGVPIDRLERLFHVDGGVIKIKVNHTALGSSTAEKARNTAQIITVVGKIGMGRAATPFEVIRKECDRKHYYDPRHFANKHMTLIDGFSVKGDARESKRLAPTNGAITAFPALVDKILGEP